MQHSYWGKKLRHRAMTWEAGGTHMAGQQCSTHSASWHPSSGHWADNRQIILALQSSSPQSLTRTIKFPYRPVQHLSSSIMELWRWTLSPAARSSQLYYKEKISPFRIFVAQASFPVLLVIPLQICCRHRCFNWELTTPTYILGSYQKSHSPFYMCKPWHYSFWKF